MYQAVHIKRISRGDPEDVLESEGIEIHHKHTHIDQYDHEPSLGAFQGVPAKGIPSLWKKLLNHTHLRDKHSRLSIRRQHQYILTCENFKNRYIYIKIHPCYKLHKRALGSRERRRERGRALCVCERESEHGRGCASERTTLPLTSGISDTFIHRYCFTEK